MSSHWREWSREDLVREYFETRLASIIEHTGVTWHWMPTDVSQDPAYWKAKDQDLHNMHYEIARRYHIKREECLWLENVVDSCNFYLTERKIKPLVDRAIRDLERLEEEKGKDEENEEEKR